MLYHLHDYQPRAVQPRHAVGRGDRPDVLVARQLADAASRRRQRRRRLRALLSARQALRKTEVRHRRPSTSAARASRCSKRRRWRGRSAACSGSPAYSDDPDVAARAAATIRRCWWWRRCPVTTPRCCARRSRRCSRDHTVYVTDWIDARAGAGRRGRLHAGRLRRLRARVHAAHRRRAPARARGLPAGRSGAGGGGADGGGRRARAAQPDPDGRADRYAPQPDPGQPLRHQQAAALVRDQPAPRGAGRLSGPRPARLSGLPAARGLHRDEPGPAHVVALGFLPRPGPTATPSSAEDHRRFYDEYNAVLDMPAEYYLDCVRIVFQQHLLPRGLWRCAASSWRPRRSPTRR